MNLNDYVKFNDSCKQFEIVTGTQGKYSMMMWQEYLF